MLKNKGSVRLVSLLVFFLALLIYLANGESLASMDSFPNSMLALNWLKSGSLHFDNFRNSFLLAKELPYYFTEAPNGHLSSTYPIGTAIVTFPIYAVFFLCLKLHAAFHHSNLPDFTSIEFVSTARFLQKLASAICGALSATLFYQISRMKFGQAIAVLITFVYAFATSAWSINSQGLWQHGSSNLVLLGIILGLLKVNRRDASQSRGLLVAIGILCGLLPGIRPTNILFAIAIIIYAIFAYRKEAVFLLLGLPSSLLSASWNFYYFGFSLKNFLVAGYSRLSSEGRSFQNTYYEFNLHRFTQAFPGLLFSPSRGLLVYSPVVVFATPGAVSMFRNRASKDEQLIICLSLASMLILLQYCFFSVWGGGLCFGSRYLTDIVPILCILVGYSLAVLQKEGQVLGIILFCILTLYSTGVQAVGVFGATNWVTIPYDRPQRFWQLQDTEIERNFNSLRYRLSPVFDSQNIKNINVSVQNLRWMDSSKLIQNHEQIRATTLHRASADIVNTGKVQLFGYPTGMRKGLASIQVGFLDVQGREIVPLTQANRLYVAEKSLQPGETGGVVGEIYPPSQPGVYKMTLKLQLKGFRRKPVLLPYVWQVEVIKG